MHSNNSRIVSYFRQNANQIQFQNTTSQFRLDKERDVESETYRLRKDLNAEERKQVDLSNEIRSLKDQLLESKNGLLAAARITDQLESCQVANAALKTECEYQTYFYLSKKKCDCFLIK